jgi:protein-tyrosine phosphatase
MTTSVLFVCLGNICRSPTAEGVMRAIVADAGLDDAILVDSAGTAGWHAGDPPDRRAAAEARNRGVDLTAQRGRQVTLEDFDRFDLVIAMDHENAAALRAFAIDESGRAKVRLLREFDPAATDGDLEVPDPYYDGPDGFVHVYDVIDAACRGLLAHLTDR